MFTVTMFYCFLDMIALRFKAGHMILVFLYPSMASELSKYRFTLWLVVELYDFYAFSFF